MIYRLIFHVAYWVGYLGCEVLRGYHQGQLDRLTDRAVASGRTYREELDADQT